MANNVKIHVDLEVDDSDYPPFAVESVWATKWSEGLYKIDNIPFYAKKLSCGDVVRAKEIDGNLRLVEVVEFSSNSTIRVVFLHDREKDEFVIEVEKAGCSYEWFDDRTLVAISIPSETSYNVLMKFVKILFDLNIVDYEEAALRF